MASGFRSANQRQVVDLKPEGRSLPVTNDNKHEWPPLPWETSYQNLGVVLIGQVKRYFAHKSRHQHGAIEGTGGFKDVLFSSLFGEDFPFDSYFSDGLKPPPRNTVRI